MPAVVITSVIATATISTGAACRTMFRRLPAVRKVGVRTLNSSMQARKNTAMDRTCAFSATKSARGEPFARSE
jgi:hypothetical protein